jgi:hypothetical protein
MLILLWMSQFIFCYVWSWVFYIWDAVLTVAAHEERLRSPDVTIRLRSVLSFLLYQQSYVWFLYFANTLYCVDQDCGINLASVLHGYFEVTARRKKFVVKDILLFIIILMGWKWVHLVLRPLFGLLYQPQMMMIVEQSVECELAGKTEVLGENLPQCHFDHHKPHITWPGLEPGY